MAQQQPAQKWYTDQRWIIVLLICLYPVGLYLLWKKSSAAKSKKILFTVLFAFASLIFWSIVIGMSGGSSQQTTQHQSKPAETAQKPAEDEQKKANAKAIADKVSTESLIVKKVQKKYRYFFAAKNGNDKSVNAKVTIYPLNGNKEKKYFGPLELEMKNLDAGLQQTGYIESSSGIEVGTYGVDAVQYYKYSVSVDGFNFDYPEQAITTKFEDTDSYGL